MRILILEDEPPIARYIESSCRKILGSKIQIIQVFYNLENAEEYILEHPIDLCLLDININGEDGYSLLQLAISKSFHTIVISAYTENAIEAFEHGVLDFISKPFDEDRLRMAFDRYFSRTEKRDLGMKYLSIRRQNEYSILPVDEILFFKAADIYVEAHLKNGKVEILDKTMDRLEQILPHNILRIHRSYLVDINEIESYKHIGGGTYQVQLKNGTPLPLSRQKYKELQTLLNY